MSFEDFKEKKVLIAPLSPITNKLANYLQIEYQMDVIGYIDSFKDGENIIKPKDIRNYNFDVIFIFSPNHFEPIYKTIKTYVSSKNIYKIDVSNNKNYMFEDRLKIMKGTIKKKFVYFNNKNKQIFLKKLSKFMDFIGYKRKKSLFIAEGFIDSNIKHIYLYYIKNKKNAILLTDNKQHYQELKKNNLPVVKLFSWKGYFYTALAKKIYLDHFILDYLEYISNKQITIQLWHGTPLKPIRDRSKFKYTYFISTSDFINKQVFKNVFQSNKFLNYGYPRNDILLTDKEDKLDLILCDNDIYSKVLKNKEENQIVIIYMPTFRENGFDKFPLDFKKLNDDMKKINAYFYVKLHPYVLDKYRDSIKEENYSNVVFYNTSGDIYPILKYVDILITDYSSIAYDFLLLDRPIIFFNYDFDEYVQARKADLGEDLLFDYNEFSPGKKVQTQIDLIKEIVNLKYGNDNFSLHRKKIRNLFFDYVDGKSCERIEKLLKDKKS